MSGDVNINKKVDEDKNQAPASKGEKLYNWLVYSGLNYWTNLAISLVVTDLFMHGKGKPFFDNGVERSTRCLNKTTPLKEKGAKWLSKVALGTFSLNSGGNILLIPTKFLEDNKRPLVHWLNDKLGVDQTAEDGHKLSSDEIYIKEEQEKQSWPRMIGRRALAWASTTVVGLALDGGLRRKLPNPTMECGELVTHKSGSDVFTEGTMNIVNKGVKAISGKEITKGSAVDRYLSYGALDWIYTKITSKVMHMTNGTKKKKMPQEIGGDTPAPIKLTNSPELEAVLNPLGAYEEQQEGKHTSAVLREKEAKHEKIRDKDESYSSAISKQQLQAAAPMQL